MSAVVIYKEAMQRARNLISESHLFHQRSCEDTGEWWFHCRYHVFRLRHEGVVRELGLQVVDEVPSGWSAVLEVFLQPFELPLNEETSSVPSTGDPYAASLTLERTKWAFMLREDRKCSWWIMPPYVPIGDQLISFGDEAAKRLLWILERVSVERR